MKVCLAGTASHKDIVLDNTPPYILESYYYFRDWQKPLINKSNFFILDSGAFTFMNRFKGSINWKEYIDKYSEFIKENNIKYFLELDIDVLVGYEKVKELTEYLECRVGKQCIPVWHKSRGIEEFKKLCEKYKYIAIGGIVTREIKPSEYDKMFQLVKYAKSKGVKVHGLGFTNLRLLKKSNFSSVDSTSWLSGGRFGQLYVFKNDTLNQISFKDRRIKNNRNAEAHNLNEWLKYVKYAEKY